MQCHLGSQSDLLLCFGLFTAATSSLDGLELTGTPEVVELVRGKNSVMKSQCSLTLNLFFFIVVSTPWGFMCNTGYSVDSTSLKKKALPRLPQPSVNMPQNHLLIWKILLFNCILLQMCFFVCLFFLNS